MVGDKLCPKVIGKVHDVMFQRRGLTATFGPRDKVMSVDFADITVLSCYSFFPSVYLVIGLPFDPLFATNTLAEDRFFQSLGIATIRTTIVRIGSTVRLLSLGTTKCAKDLMSASTKESCICTCRLPSEIA